MPKDQVHHSQTQQIEIRLGNYEDIFSDFDMRPHAGRALSVDFLDEIKRASIDKSDDIIDLILNVPEGSRNPELEETIKQRLANHFKRHYFLLQKEKGKVVRTGVGMVMVGIIFMLFATRLHLAGGDVDTYLSFFRSLLEPMALFLLWEGMDQIIFNSKNVNPNLFFYKKMYNSEGHIEFRSY